MKCEVLTLLGLAAGVMVGSFFMATPRPAGACKCAVESELATLERLSADRIDGTDDVTDELAKWPTEAFMRGDDPQGERDDVLALNDGTNTLVTAARDAP